jgi:hypothetical protein
MPSIFAGVVPELQAFAEGEMLDGVTIRRKGARTATALGGSSYGPDIETETVGRIAPLSKATVERLSGGQLRYEGLEELHLPRTTDIRSADTVAVTSVRHATTQAYTVEGLVPLATFAVDRVALVRAI